MTDIVVAGRRVMSVDSFELPTPQGTSRGERNLPTWGASSREATHETAQDVGRSCFGRKNGARQDIAILLEWVACNLGDRWKIARSTHFYPLLLLLATHARSSLVMIPLRAMGIS